MMNKLIRFDATTDFTITILLAAFLMGPCAKAPVIKVEDCEQKEEMIGVNPGR